MGDNLAPVDLGTGKTATDIATGRSTCALLNDGTVRCWGGNSNGSLGIGTEDSVGRDPGEMGDNLAAVDLGTGKTATALFGKEMHFCALLNDNTVKCWGDNHSGQLGQGHANSLGDDPGEMGDNLAAVDLGTGKTATTMAIAEADTCALLNDGTVKCWGSNGSGELGQGHARSVGDDSGEMGDNLAAVDLGTGKTATAITGGTAFFCALLNDGTVKCWGRNTGGRLGQGHTNRIGDQDGEMGDNLAAVDLGTGKTATAIAAGSGYVCAILNDGTLRCWGENDLGQLGQGHANFLGDDPGEMGDNLAAVDLGTGKTATAISAGYSHICALLNDSSVKCWGYGASGRLGYPAGVVGDGLGEMGDNLPTVDLGS
jgi:alpha-tubulin suppressor-like RCC1 family protein